MNKGKILIYVSVVTTLILWYSGITDTTITLKLLTRITALVGVILLAWNYLLATRLEIFDYLFDGLDKVYNIHHWLGKWGFLFVLAHPILLVLNALDKSLKFSQYLIPSTIPSYSLGVFSLYLFIILIIVTIFVKLPYHLWKLTHDLMGIPLFFLILHVYMVSSDVSNNLLLRLWVLGFLIIAFVAFIYKRFFYESINSSPYKITEVTKVSAQAWKIDLQNIGKVKTINAGQFVFIKRKNGYGSDELHPFSVISYNKNGDLSLGIKELGDYTNRLGEWKKGEQVSIFGPHGRFGDYFVPSETQVWIAGGVGITPFLSVLSNYAKNTTNINAHLIYIISGDDSNVPFESILNEYRSKIQGFDFSIWDSKQMGHITAEHISINEIDRFLICASPSLTTSLIDGLKNKGVKSSKIKKELFTLY